MPRHQLGGVALVEVFAVGQIGFGYCRRGGGRAARADGVKRSIAVAPVHKVRRVAIRHGGARLSNCSGISDYESNKDAVRFQPVGGQKR